MAQESFPKWRAGVRAFVQGGMWRWALAIGFSVALGGGVWAYDVFGPKIRAAWPRWKVEGAPWVQQTLAWIEFLASITLTLALLSWSTAILFCLLYAILFSASHLLERASRRFSSRARLARLHQVLASIVERGRLLGTAVNLIASVGALATLTAVLKRPLDYWDLGIQIAVSAAIESIVLEALFAKGRLGFSPLGCYNKPEH